MTRPVNFSTTTPRALALAAALSLAAGVLPGCKNQTPQAPGDTPANVAGTEQGVNDAENKIRSGDLAAAIAELEAIIKRDPNSVRARMALADILSAPENPNKDYDKAGNNYKVASDVDPKNFDAAYRWGLMRHVGKKLTEAITAYLRALSIKPDDFQANLNLATAYYQLGENVQARPFGEKAVRLNPKDGPARFNLGAIYAGLDMHEQALIEYQQATELMAQDKMGPLLLNMAESFSKLNRFNEMKSTLEALTKSKPTAEAYERLGYANFKLRDLDSATSNFDQALASDPNYFPALNGIGVCYLNKWLYSDKMDTDAKSKAMNALRRSLQLNRDQPRIEELLSRYGANR
jgi:tetratricopeptide (TPR) repeat protein